MPLALWRALVIAVTISLTGPGCYDTPGSPTALAETHRSLQDQPSTSKRSRNSRISMTPTTIGITTIQNLRTAVSSDVTRLVLDLDHVTRTPARPAPQAKASSLKSRAPRWASPLKPNSLEACWPSPLSLRKPPTRPFRSHCPPARFSPTNCCPSRILLGWSSTSYPQSRPEACPLPMPWKKRLRRSPRLFSQSRREPSPSRRW